MTLALVRCAAAPLVPVPSAVRAGDYVFTSTIYPIDDHGHAVTDGVDELGAGQSLISRQAEQCFARLEDILRSQNANRADVLKVYVHLVDGTGFYEFKLAWEAFFGKDAPARTVIEIGDTLPFRGAMLSIDAIALAGGTTLRREVLRDPSGDDPMAAEGAPHAVRAGRLVFCSGFTASDFVRGITVGKAAGFPNYGNDATAQAEYIFERLNRVLATVGTSLEHALESYLYEPDLQTFHHVDSVWRRYMPLPPGRASMGVTGLIVPNACMVADFTVLIPDEAHRKEELHAGISYHPVAMRKVNFTPTLRAGPWLYLAGKTAGDMRTVHGSPAGLPNHFSDIEVQTRHVLDYLTNQMQSNGSDWSHCHHVRVWLVEPRRDYRGFMRVWQSYFPDPTNAPALAYVPSTGIMYPGPLIEIDPTCVLKPH